jgi:hypothetical protein
MRFGVGYEPVMKGLFSRLCKFVKVDLRLVFSTCYESCGCCVSGTHADVSAGDKIRYSATTSLA